MGRRREVKGKIPRCWELIRGVEIGSAILAGVGERNFWDERCCFVVVVQTWFVLRGKFKGDANFGASR
jgi:hypothetical protein